jgi:hypothetical protein
MIMGQSLCLRCFPRDYIYIQKMLSKLCVMEVGAFRTRLAGEVVRPREAFSCTTTAPTAPDQRHKCPTNTRSHRIRKLTGDPSPHTLNHTDLTPPLLVPHIFHSQQPTHHDGTDAASTVTRTHQRQVAPHWQLICREEQSVVTFLR